MTRRRRLTVVAAIAATILATLGVIGGANAAWLSADTVTGTATAGQTGVSLTGFNTISNTYTSAGQTSSVTTVTVTNTGTVPLNSFATTTTIPGGAAGQTLAGKMSVAFWPKPAGSACASTVPAGVTSYTWATVPAWLAGQGVLAVGASASYCVLSSISAADADSYANTSFSPSLTVSANDQNWTTGNVQAAAFTLATGTATSVPVTVVTPVQIGVNSSNGSTSVGTITMPPTVAGAGSNLDVNGTLVNTSFVCTSIGVNGMGQTAAPWQIGIDMTLPPYNGVALSDPDFVASADGIGNYQMARIIGQPVNGVYQVGGAGTIDTSHPLNSIGNGQLYNTPMKAGQSTTISFCVNISQNTNLPKIFEAGNGTYTVSNQKVVSCQNNAQLPVNNWDTCVVTTVTGLYPHFEIGYKFTIDLAALANNTAGLNAEVKIKLTGTTAISWRQIASNVPNGGAQPGNVQTSHNGSVFSFSSAGILASNGGISNDQNITLLGQLSP